VLDCRGLGDFEAQVLRPLALDRRRLVDKAIQTRNEALGLDRLGRHVDEYTSLLIEQIAAQRIDGSLSDPLIDEVYEIEPLGVRHECSRSRELASAITRQANEEFDGGNRAQLDGRTALEREINDRLSEHDESVLVGCMFDVVHSCCFIETLALATIGWRRHDQPIATSVLAGKTRGVGFSDSRQRGRSRSRQHRQPDSDSEGDALGADPERNLLNRRPYTFSYSQRFRLGTAQEKNAEAVAAETSYRVGATYDALDAVRDFAELTSEKWSTSTRHNVADVAPDETDFNALSS